MLGETYQESNLIQDYFDYRFLEQELSLQFLLYLPIHHDGFNLKFSLKFLVNAKLFYHYFITFYSLNLLFLS